MNWIERRIAAAREQGATSLDLSLSSSKLPGESSGSGVLTSIPAAIFDLAHLERLDLGGHDIAEIPPAIGRMASLRELTVSNHRGGVTVCREIRRLLLRRLAIECNGELAVDLELVPELQDLWLSANTLAFSGLGSLATLTRLRLHFPMGSVPAALRGLRSIRSLALHDSATHALGVLLPVGDLGCSESLEELELSGAWDLSRSLMPRLASLGVGWGEVKIPDHFFRLPLRVLHLNEPDDRFTQLTQLEDLTLYGSGWPLLPPGFISSLIHLKGLALHFLAVDGAAVETVLEHGALEKLTLIRVEGRPVISLGHCKQLKRLHLDTSHELEGTLGDLELLEHLTLWGGKASAVRDLHGLKHLQFLSLGDMSLAGWPEGLSDLTELKSLTLHSTSLKTIPAAACGLRNLEHLDLSGNELREIPRDLAELPRLKDLDLSGNPIATPPPEIAARGLAAIQGYFESLREGPVEELYEAKLLLVGEGGVGKTLLARRLLEPDADLARVAPELGSTRGIEIREWALAAGAGKSFRVHLWDFGGQEIYHATHQFFLTRRSLYLFVWDARKEDREAGFDYWLNVVTLLSAGSPILVVLNKADERVREIDRRSLQQKFPNVRGFHAVSALDGRGIAELIRDVRANATGLPHVGERWAFSWSRVRARLEADGRDYIDRDEYLRLCAGEGLDQTAAELLSGYLHDLGVILHFQDDPLLGNLVVLRPEWATNAVYDVLDTRAVQDRFGRFSRRDLAAIWSRTTYPPAKHAELLQLMSRFELCFRLGDSQDYVAPELLSASAPEYSWQPEGELRLDYRYAFMPAGILTRFIARNHAMIERDLYWRNGTVLAWEGARARVVAEPLNRRIRVGVVGREQRDLLAVVRRELDHIHGTLNHPEVEEMVPCTCATCAAAVEPHFHKFRELVAYRQSGMRDVPCPRGLRPVAIDDLLEGFRGVTPSRYGFQHGDVRAGHIAAASPVQVVVNVQPAVHEKTIPVLRSERSRPASPWLSGLFYLFAVAAIAAVFAAVGKVVSPWALPVIIGGAVLTLAVVGALQLRQDRGLTEKSFLTLMGMALRRLPWLGRVGRGAEQGHNTPEGD
jgi:internalin A